MKEWLIKKVLLGWLKKELEKIPGEGIKTLFGVLLLILGVLKEHCLLQVSLLCSAVDPAMDFLIGLNPSTIQDVGIVAIIVGLTHKILKFFEKRSENTEALKLSDLNGAA